MDDGDGSALCIQGIIPACISLHHYAEKFYIAICPYWRLLAFPSACRKKVMFAPYDDIVPMNLHDAQNISLPQPPHPEAFSIGKPASEEPPRILVELSKLKLISESVGCPKESFVVGHGDMAFTGSLPRAEPMLLVADSCKHCVHVLDVRGRKHAGYLAPAGYLISPKRLACRRHLVVVETCLPAKVPVYFVFEYDDTSLCWQIIQVIPGVMRTALAACLWFQHGNDSVFCAAYCGGPSLVDFEGVFDIRTGTATRLTIVRDPVSEPVRRTCIDVQIARDDADGRLVARKYEGPLHNYYRVLEYFPANLFDEPLEVLRCTPPGLSPWTLIPHPDAGVIFGLINEYGVPVLLWVGTACQLRKANLSKIRVAWMATVARSVSSGRWVGGDGVKKFLFSKSK